jgi:glucokinase
MDRSFKIRMDTSNESYLSFMEDARGLAGVKGTILAGDIGGTKTNLSIYDLKEGLLQPVFSRSFLTGDFNSFSELYESMPLKDLPQVDSLCLGVAGPVTGGRVEGTNFPWVLEEEKLRTELKIAPVALINDMEANAYGLAVLKDNDFRIVKKGEGFAGNAALISPGTGLGEAGMYWDGRKFHPFAAEGGHCDFSPRDELDINFLQFLQQVYGHVSWERIISGPGIFNIYKFLKEYRQVIEPEWFSQLIKEQDPAAVISQCAAGDRYPVCSEVMDLFQRYLAIETAQIALKLKATGGIYIGGGILPKILDLFNIEKFMNHFLSMNRMNPLLEKMGIKVILNENSPMYGAAFFAARQLWNDYKK